MSFFCRVFTKEISKIEITDFENAVKGMGARVKIHETDEKGWKSLLLEDKDGIPVCFLDRDEVLAESIGEEEICEFLEEMETARPKAAAEWVGEYLKETKVIYAFELLEGIDTDEGYEAFDLVRNVIFDKAGGIFQADGEGFSNEEGFHIIWQFDDVEVEGPWEMAVLEKDGKWKTFEMELSDREQQREFKDGKVPKNSKPVQWN